MVENKYDLLKGFLIGGLAGLALGILFAPKSGRETREDIAKASESAIRRLKELEAVAEKKLEDTGKKVGDLALQGKETLQENKDRFKKAVDAGIEAYKAGKENA